jgi:hypothetical protein
MYIWGLCWRVVTCRLMLKRWKRDGRNQPQLAEPISGYNGRTKVSRRFLIGNHKWLCKTQTDSTILDIMHRVAMRGSENEARTDASNLLEAHRSVSASRPVPQLASRPSFPHAAS